jgi:hypothetical protein
MSSNKKFGFWNMLWGFGPLKLIKCYEFYVSLSIPVIVFYFLFYTEHQKVSILKLEIIKLFIGVDATILAVIITGLAILLSISDSKFIKVLVNSKNLYVRFFSPSI